MPFNNSVSENRHRKRSRKKSLTSCGRRWWLSRSWRPTTSSWWRRTSREPWEGQTSRMATETQLCPLMSNSRSFNFIKFGIKKHLSTSHIQHFISTSDTLHFNSLVLHLEFQLTSLLLFHLPQDHLSIPSLYYGTTVSMMRVLVVADDMAISSKTGFFTDF